MIERRLRERSNEKIADLNTKAADALRTAEQEKHARLKLEQRFADRTLTDPEVSAIADKLRTYAGQRFSVITWWNQKEPKAITIRLMRALQCAGWVYVPNSQFFLEPVVGMYVNTSPGAGAHVMRAAGALASVLNDKGLACQLSPWKASSNPPDVIFLDVGTKW
jgi:hypothetical protein